MEQQSIKAGRIFYGTMIIGLGCQQLYYGDFRPVIAPAWSALAQCFGWWGYIFGALFILSGLAIIFNKKAREISLLLGALFLLLAAFCQAPYEILIDPYSNHLGSWTNALKELVLSGGGFIVAASYAGDSDSPSLIWFLEKFIPFGPALFSITMILFGIAHFLYVQYVSVLVPSWIGANYFWTYFAGAALAAGGLAIMFRIKLKQVSLSMGLMIFLWLFIIHIPRTIAAPGTDNGNELTSVFEALGFSGIAFVIAFAYDRKKAGRTADSLSIV